MVRRIVLAVLAVVVGFGLYLFWAVGGPATTPTRTAAPETAAETTPAAAGVADTADAAPEAPAGAALESEIRGLVDEAVEGQAAPASGTAAPDN